MDAHDDMYNWKKVFKKFLNKQEDSSFSQNNFEESSSDSDNNVAEEKKVSDSSLLTSSYRNNDSGYDNCKLPSACKMTLEKIPAHAEVRTRKEGTNIDCDNNVKLPEWNKAFKEILSNKSPVVDNRNQKKNQYSVQKPGSLQKLDVSVNTSQKPRKNLHKMKEIKECTEEKKARELFAQARELKKINYHINDFDGAGVDIFEHDRSVLPHKKSVESIGLEPGWRLVPDYPLTGFVAKYKNYTTADLITSPSIPFDEEPWDDELLI